MEVQVFLKCKIFFQNGIYKILFEMQQSQENERAQYLSLLEQKDQDSIRNTTKTYGEFVERISLRQGFLRIISNIKLSCANILKDQVNVQDCRVVDKFSINELLNLLNKLGCESSLNFLLSKLDGSNTGPEKQLPLESVKDIFDSVDVENIILSLRKNKEVFDKAYVKTSAEKVAYDTLLILIDDIKRGDKNSLTYHYSEFLMPELEITKSNMETVEEKFINKLVVLAFRFLATRDDVNKPNNIEIITGENEQKITFAIIKFAKSTIDSMLFTRDEDLSSQQREIKKTCKAYKFFL